MTTQAKFEMMGLAEYLEAIAKAGEDVDAAAHRALKKGGEILEKEMERLAPVGETGNLQAHVQLRGPLQEGNFSFVEVGVIHQIDYTGADVAIYGNVQEYGSPSKNIKAQPYIRPAIDGKKNAVKKAIKDSLKAEGFVD